MTCSMLVVTGAILACSGVAENSQPPQAQEGHWPGVCVMVPTNRESLIDFVSFQISEQQYPTNTKRTLLVLSDAPEVQVSTHDAPEWTKNSVAVQRLHDKGWDLQWRRVPFKTSLGTKRNVAVGLCKDLGFKDTDIAVQWDDDDLSFPSRLQSLVSPLRPEHNTKMSVLAQGIWYDAKSNIAYKAVGTWSPNYGTLAFRLGAWDPAAGVAYNAHVKCGEEKAFLTQVVGKHGKSAVAIVQNSATHFVHVKHQGSTGCFNMARLFNQTQFLPHSPLSPQSQARLKTLASQLQKISGASHSLTESPFSWRKEAEVCDGCTVDWHPPAPTPYDGPCMSVNGPCVTDKKCHDMYGDDEDLDRSYCGHGPTCSGCGVAWTHPAPTPYDGPCMSVNGPCVTDKKCHDMYGDDEDLDRSYCGHGATCSGCGVAWTPPAPTPYEGQCLEMPWGECIADKRCNDMYEGDPDLQEYYCGIGQAAMLNSKKSMAPIYLAGSASLFTLLVVVSLMLARRSRMVDVERPLLE